MVGTISQPPDVSLRCSSESKNVLGGTFRVAFGRRSYSPELGRWVNRDPIGESGGVSVNVIAENNCVNSIDFLGFWEFFRKSSDNWAMAIAEEGDTFQALADLISLDYAERTAWLLAGPYAVNESDEAKAGCGYKIPNTVGVYTSKPGWLDWPTAFVTKLRSDAIYLGTVYESFGFKVLYREEQSSVQMFIDLWSTDGIYAMAFAGHGGEADGDWFGFHADPTDEDGYVAPDQVDPPYHLSAIYAFTCGSANPIIDMDPDLLPGGQMSTSSWLDYLSRRGYFHGFWGAVNYLNASYRTVIIDRGRRWGNE